jgi:hypothetical protein
MEEMEFNFQYDCPISTWAKAGRGNPILQSGETYRKIGVKIKIGNLRVTWEYDNVSEYGQETHLYPDHAKISRDKFDENFDIIKLGEIHNSCESSGLSASDNKYLQDLAGYPIDYGLINDLYRGDIDIHGWVSGNFNDDNK